MGFEQSRYLPRTKAGGEDVLAAVKPGSFTKSLDQLNKHFLTLHKPVFICRMQPFLPQNAALFPRSIFFQKTQVSWRAMLLSLHSLYSYCHFLLPSVKPQAPGQYKDLECGVQGKRMVEISRPRGFPQASCTKDKLLQASLQSQASAAHPSTPQQPPGKLISTQTWKLLLQKTQPRAFR